MAQSSAHPPLDFQGNASTGSIPAQAINTCNLSSFTATTVLNVLTPSYGGGLGKAQNISNCSYFVADLDLQFIHTKDKKDKHKDKKHHVINEQLQEWLCG